MKSAAVLAVTAFFAFGGGAFAGTIVSLDGYCDQITITQNGKALVGGLETDENGRCETFLGGGVVGKVRGVVGKQAIIGGVINSSPGAVYTFTFSEPLVTGGTWASFVTTDGVTETPLATGTYTVTGAASATPATSKRVTDTRR